MSNTFITVVVIVVVAGLLFVVPLVTMEDRLDTTTVTQVQAIVANYVDDIISTREITQEKKDKFTQDLNALGFAFDYEMEIMVLDENEGKKVSQTAKDKIGENGTYSIFTTDIERELEQKGFKKLDSGWLVSMKVKEKNSKPLKTFFYKIVKNDDAAVVASKAGMVQ